MMSTVKNAFSAIGDRGGDLARGTGGLARRVGAGTADVAKKVGSSTADIAKRIGPKRGLIGLAVLAVAVGGTIVLVRYLRARDEDIEGLESSEEDVTLQDNAGVRRRRGRRNRSNGMSSTAR